MSQNQQMAALIFAKHAGISRREAEKIIASSNQDSVDALCLLSPTDAKSAVEKAFAEIRRKEADALTAKQIRQPDGQLNAEEEDEPTPADQPTGRDGDAGATDGSVGDIAPDGPDIGEPSSGLNAEEGIEGEDQGEVD